MTLLALLLIGALVGLLTGAVLRRVGIISRLADMGFGLVGAFVVGAMGSGALIQGWIVITRPLRRRGRPGLCCWFMSRRRCFGPFMPNITSADRQSRLTLRPG
jgi:uncharacterized membrane protein YeaQ/YmgE (transglycosylase-associated protein family)